MTPTESKRLADLTVRSCTHAAKAQPNPLEPETPKPTDGACAACVAELLREGRPRVNAKGDLK